MAFYFFSEEGSAADKGKGVDGTDTLYLARHLPAGILVVLVIELGISVWLHLRQYFHVRSITQIPEVLARYGDGMYTSVDLDLSREYELDKIWHDAGSKIYTVLGWIALVHFQWVNYGWSLAKQISLVWPVFLNRIVASNMSFAMVCYGAYHIFRMPKAAHKILTRSRHGYHSSAWRNENLLYELRDFATKLVPVGLGAGLLTTVVQGLERQSGFMQIAILAGCSTLFIVAYPTMEIWGILEDVEDERKRKRKSEEFGRRRHLLRELCDSVGFPRRKLILVESSKGVGSAAAASTFYFGFLFYRRIAVFFSANNATPTRVQVQTESETVLSMKEVEGVVAHELGHWYYFHSDKAVLLWHALHIGTVIGAYGLHSSQVVLKGFGLPKEVGTRYLPAMLLAYCLVLRPFYYVLKVLYNLNQQASEREADRFAACLGYKTELARSLVKIGLVAEQRVPSDDKFYSIFYHKHPCLVERLELIDQVGICEFK